MPCSAFYILMDIFVQIDFPEFLMLMAGGSLNDNEEEQRVKQIQEREEELVDMFYLLDKDRSGSVSADELATVMCRFGGLNKGELDVLIQEADANGDGMVSSKMI